MKTKYTSIAAVVVLAGGTFLGAANMKGLGTRSAVVESLRVSQRVSARPDTSQPLRVVASAIQSEAVRGQGSKSEVTIKDRKQVPLALAATKQQARSTISFYGQITPVITGNTTITTAPSGNRAQTWGGQTHLSVTDGQSTHLIGHNTTNFGKITKMRVGTPITVRDSAGHTRVYHVTWYKDVNDQGYIVGTRTSVYQDIVNAHQGEQIVLQTCINDHVNRVVWAR